MIISSDVDGYNANYNYIIYNSSLGPQSSLNPAALSFEQQFTINRELKPSNIREDMNMTVDTQVQGRVFMSV